MKFPKFFSRERMPEKSDIKEEEPAEDIGEINQRRMRLGLEPAKGARETPQEERGRKAAEERARVAEALRREGDQSEMDDRWGPQGGSEKDINPESLRVWAEEEDKRRQEELEEARKELESNEK